MLKISSLSAQVSRFRLTHCLYGYHWSSELVHSCLGQMGDGCSTTWNLVQTSGTSQKDPGHSSGLDLQLLLEINILRLTFLRA